MNVYLAAPLFTQAERCWNRELATALEKGGVRVFLPQETASPPLFREPPDFYGSFAICRDGIDAADAVVAILDGADADSGTCWECGYAYARSKPVIAVRTDFRAGADMGLNLMLSRSARAIVRPSSPDDGVVDLAARILETLRTLHPKENRGP